MIHYLAPELVAVSVIEEEKEVEEGEKVNHREVAVLVLVAVAPAVVVGLLSARTNKC